MRVKKLICGCNVSFSKGADTDLKHAHGIDLVKEIEKYIREDQRRERDICS